MLADSRLAVEVKGVSNVLAISGAAVAFFIGIGSIVAILVGHQIHWAMMTPEQREAQTAKNKAAEAKNQKDWAALKESAREAKEQQRREQPVFNGYSGYEYAPTRRDIQKPVVVKTLARMTAPWVRKRLIEDMAANGYALTNLTRTTTGKTIATFNR
jgi:hypothetical protein